MTALATALSEARPEDIIAQVARLQAERDALQEENAALREILDLKKSHETDLILANNREVERRRQAERALDASSFQHRVGKWMQACFGADISADRLERGDRLVEEVLELLQSVGYPPERVVALLAYVWDRPAGDPQQEVGGVMVTLAAFCAAHDLGMHTDGEAELDRIWGKIEQIRAKQAAKPTGSALPKAEPEQFAWPHADKWGGPSLLKQARALCEAIERLPGCIDQSNLISLASGAAHALQGLQMKDHYFWHYPGLSGATPPMPAQGWSPTHRHVKRGSTYRLLGKVQVQAPSDDPLTDYELAYLYQSADGQLWVRRCSEFDDGRFEAIPTRKEA
jgi:hypothetical protein